MRFEELRTLREGPPLSSDELTAFGTGVFAECGYFLENDLLCLEPKVVAELDRLVEPRDLVLDVFDQQRLLRAALRIALSPDANEVRVDLTASATGVGDDESAATLVPAFVVLAADD